MTAHDALSAIESSLASNFVLTEEIVQKYSLDRWASEFSLMTAGYRDPLDPADAAGSDVPFNVVAVAIFAEAKARVFKRKLAQGQQGHVHVGGETRPHTQTFIQIAARVYAAHGFHVHLRRGVKTTPIWYSSFGVFYEEYQSGDSFTASHSQYFKGGWKPMDGYGQQLLEEEAEIIAEVRAIVAGRQTISLGAWMPNPSIDEDFDVDAAYLEFLRTVVADESVRQFAQAGKQGFRVSICTMGGSMKPTTKKFFATLGIPTGPEGVVRYFLSEEDSQYHGIGTCNGTDIGVDPGKPEIYEKLVAQAGLLEGKTDMVLLWDPDGDRLNIATKAPKTFRESAAAAGLQVDRRSMGEHCIVYFTPNQLYLLLAEFRIEAMREAGRLNDNDWFVGLSYPTTKMLEELAQAEGLKCVRVPVGFKYIGNLCAEIEPQLGGDVVFEMTNGRRVPLGKRPRALILCEESGGGTLGGGELLKSRSGEHAMLALREKDGMQLGLLSMCLGAKLFMAGRSFAEHFCDIVAAKGIKFIHYNRADVRLYDESLTGPALRAAKDDGVKKRDRVMDFFGGLADQHKAGKLSLEEVRRAIVAKAPKHADRFPALTQAYRLGNDLLHGMLFEADNLRLIVRASGTDALMRYYVESTDSAALAAVQEMLRGLDI
jgi:phosphomannomutase